MTDKVITVEVYERDLNVLRELIPSMDDFKDKFRVILSLVRAYEDKVSRS